MHTVDNSNETDNTFGNALAIATLRGAHELAADAGVTPNATFLALASRVHLPYDAARDYHVSAHTSSTAPFQSWPVRLLVPHSRSLRVGIMAVGRMTVVMG